MPSCTFAIYTPYIYRAQGSWPRDPLILRRRQHVFRLLDSMAFSVQCPRKRLLRADEERQAVWVRDAFPAIKESDRLPHFT